MFDNSLYKIGRSNNPKKRLSNIKVGNIDISLVCYGLGVSEKKLHKLYSEKRVDGEWFDLSKNDVNNITHLISREFTKENENPHTSLSIKRQYIEFINDFKNKKYHRSYSLTDYDLYSYSSNKGKFGVSNILIDILVKDFSAIEFRLFFAIVNTLKQSTIFEESAVVFLKYSLYSEYCSVNVFGTAVRKFTEYNFLISTPKNKYYVVNPLYINKFYKSKIKK